MNETAKKIHAEIMWWTHELRVKMRGEVPTIFISRGLYDMLFDDLDLGEHIIPKNDEFVYFGCPCEIVESWEDIRFAVGFE